MLSVLLLSVKGAEVETFDEAIQPDSFWKGLVCNPTLNFSGSEEFTHIVVDP